MCGAAVGDDMEGGKVNRTTQQTYNQETVMVLKVDNKAS